MPRRIGILAACGGADGGWHRVRSPSRAVLSFSFLLRMRPYTQGPAGGSVGGLYVVEYLAERVFLADFSVGEFEDVTAADESAGAVGGLVVEGPFGDSDVSVDECGPVVAFTSVVVGEDCGEPASHLVLAAVGGARLGADRCVVDAVVGHVAHESVQVSGRPGGAELLQAAQCHRRLAGTGHSFPVSAWGGAGVRPGRDGDGAGELIEVSEVMPGDLGDHQGERLTPLLTVSPRPLPSAVWGVAEQCGVVGPQPGEHADAFGGLGMRELRPELLVISGVCGILFGQHEPEPESVDDVDVDEVSDDLRGVPLAWAERNIPLCGGQVLAESAHLPGGRFVHLERVAIAEGVEQGADVGGGFGGGVGDLDGRRRAAASGAGHAVSPQSAGVSCPCRTGRRPSVGWPSRTQYSSPPIISLTCLPWAASSIAPLVAALHDGPQQ